MGLSQTPCWKRVQKLEAAGIITGRVAMVDPGLIGLGLTVFVEIEAADHTPEWRDAFAAAVTAHPSDRGGPPDGGRRGLSSQGRRSRHGGVTMHFYLDLTRRVRCRNVTSKFSMERIKATSLLPIDTTTA